MIPFGYKDCINSDESIQNSKSEAIMSSKSNYRYIQNNAGKCFGKKGSKSKTIKLLKSASNLVCRIDWVWYFLQKLLLLAELIPRDYFVTS